MSNKRQILDDRQIGQILRRIAYQIYENHLDDKNLVFAGICDPGQRLAEVLVQELAAIAPTLRIRQVSIEIDKKHPEDSVRLGAQAADITNQSIILIDDVLNTGKTLAYGLHSLLQYSPSRVEIAVLVNRKHKAFPVYATYTGYELSTMLDEHIEVELGKLSCVYLH